MSHARRVVGNRAAIGTAALLAALAVAALAMPAGAEAAKGRTVWLCRPGKEHNPCRGGSRTQLVSPSGEKRGIKKPGRSKPRKIDCFYVYPTVSDQQSENANLHLDPEERSIALYQAARYSQLCRVYAPMYRQVTLKGIADPSSVSPHAQEVAYNSALRAWKTYLRKYNDGRGVVMIGHSQGTFILRSLIANEIDPSRGLRNRLVSAILLGGNVTVADGSDAGGDFDHIRACHSKTQLHCVVAFSTFDAQVPADSLFGRTTDPACTSCAPTPPPSAADRPTSGPSNRASRSPRTRRSALRHASSAYRRSTPTPASSSSTAPIPASARAPTAQTCSRSNPTGRHRSCGRSQPRSGDCT